MQQVPNSMTDIINVTPTPRLEITTPEMRNPGVAVELEATVSVAGKAIYNVKLLVCS